MIGEVTVCHVIDGEEYEFTASGTVLPPERSVGIMDWSVADLEIDVTEVFSECSEEDLEDIEAKAEELLIEQYQQGEQDEYEPEC